MDVAAADALARKKLSHLPNLNKKVQEARVIQQYQSKGKVDADVAAAKARVAKLQAAAEQAVRFNPKLAAPYAPLSVPGNGKQLPNNGSVKQNALEDAMCADESATNKTAEPQAFSAPAGTAKHPSEGATVAPSAAAKQPAPLATVASITSAAQSGDDQQQQSSATNRSCATSSTAKGCSNIGCRRPPRRSSNSSSKEYQQQHQLAMADGILSAINDYIADELSQATAAAQSLLALQEHQLLQQNAAIAASATSQGTATAATATAQAGFASASSTSNINQPAELTSGEGRENVTVTAAPEAAKAAALQQLGIDSEGYTPELLASLAMRFQDYNLPHSISSMPDLGTIAVTVLQEEQNKQQQQRHQQELRLLEQRRQQVARQMAANRHLQLYQLGVMQQRQKLGQPVKRDSLAHHASSTMKTKQQDTSKSAPPGMSQQQIQPGKGGPNAPCQPWEEPSRRARFSSAGDGSTVAVATVDISAHAAGAAAVCQEQPSIASVSVSADHHGQATAAVLERTMSRCSQEAEVDAATTGMSGQHGDTATAVLCNIVKSVGSGNSSAPGVPVPGDCKAAVTSAVNSCSCSKPLNSVASAGHLSATEPCITTSQQVHGLWQVPACTPPSIKYKTDLPGASAGASHGHLSPAGMKFDHLPGSRRQVYAQIQDALACSDAIAAAEQTLRDLTYAPCAGTQLRSTSGSSSVI